MNPYLLRENNLPSYTLSSRVHAIRGNGRTARRRDIVLSNGLSTTSFADHAVWNWKHKLKYKYLNNREQAIKNDTRRLCPITIDYVGEGNKIEIKNNMQSVVDFKMSVYKCFFS